MQLLSITLLEPMVNCPNYASTDPLKWFPKRITLGDMSETGSPLGIRTLFDSGQSIWYCLLGDELTNTT